MYYKVTKHNLTSLVMNQANTGMAVQYVIGEFVFADPSLFELGYGLFVFNNLEVAKSWLECEGDRRLFEVDVLDPLPELPPSFDYILVNKVSVLKSDVCLMTGSAFPDNSVVVKGVKLVRELTDF
jgi:hypothetical protein